jgi:hypothetical protein
LCNRTNCKSLGENNVFFTELDVTIEVVVTGLLEEKGVKGISEDLGKVITPLQLLLTEIVESEWTDSRVLDFRHTYYILDHKKVPLLPMYLLMEYGNVFKVKPSKLESTVKPGQHV